MSNEYYFSSAISQYGNLKSIILDNITNNESRVPNDYTRDKITQAIIDTYVAPNTKKVLESGEFNPTEDYERHYEYVRRFSVQEIRDKLHEYGVLRMTPLTSKVYELKKLIDEINDLSFRNILTQDGYDDFTSAEQTLRDMEKMINHSLSRAICTTKTKKEFYEYENDSRRF